MGKLVIIMLAAGKASRMGAPKQLLSWRGKTVIENRADLITSLPNIKTIVVTGAYNIQVEEKLKNYPIKCIHNPNWQAGMGTSIAVAVKAAIQENPNGIMVMLCDQLALQKQHLIDLIQLFNQHKGQSCICSFYNNIHGVPAIFPPNWFHLLMNLNGNSGARKLFSDSAQEFIAFPLDEAAIDIDTPEDWENFIG